MTSNKKLLASVFLIAINFFLVGCQPKEKGAVKTVQPKKLNHFEKKRKKIRDHFSKLAATYKNDMLKAADPIVGEKMTSLCLACHNVIEGQPSKGVSQKRVFVGPNLYGVFDREIASLSDFEYSEAMLKLQGQKWNVENLDKFLKHPSHFVPRTKMKYPGVLDPQDRMDIIAYLMVMTYKVD